MELNREKIIKALECCEHIQCQGEHCPYHPLDRCREQLRHDCYALIKELTEENERLHASCTELAQECASLNDKCASLNGENERLKNICDSYMLQYGTATDKEAFLKGERADTVRKMHSLIKERCIAGGIYPAFVASTIEKVAKELLGE